MFPASEIMNGDAKFWIFVYVTKWCFLKASNKAAFA